MKKQLLTLLTLLLAICSGAWADTEIIFSAEAIVTADTSFPSGTTEITSSQATISGGKMYAINGQTKAVNLMRKAGFCMTNNNTIFKIELNKALEAGDVITASSYGGDKNGTAKGIWVTTTEARPSSAPACSAAATTPTTMTANFLNYTVAANDGYVGATTLYVHRAAGATQDFDLFVVTRTVAAAAAPTITTDLSSTADAFVGEAKTFSIVATGATAYQWYKCDDANKTNPEAIANATSASYSYTAAAAGTEYIYCAATNTVGTTTSTVCAVTATAPDFIPVTFGLTRPLDATQGTMGANNWLTADDRFTLTEVYGSDVLPDGGNRTYYIDNVAYTATYSYKKQTNTTSFDSDHWFGYTFTIPENKALDITQVDARLSDASNATWTWKIQVEDANGNSLWNTGNKTTSGNSTTTVSINDNNLKTALAGLTPGATYYAKIYYYQAGTTKCATIDLTFNGKLVDPQATAPTITLASAASAMVGVPATLTAKVTAYPDVTAYQWYQCDDANKSNPQAVDNATSETLTFTPAATGTLYYYLTATNTVGTTASDVCTVTVNEASITVDAILNNETGSKLESGEQVQGQAYSFGINLNNERVAADAADAVVVISGTYHNDHGSTNIVATVKATGNMKFTLGNCTYNNGNATLKNASNETLKTVDLSGTGCWKGTHTDVTTFYYEGEAQTLTLSVSSYIPYIKVESVGDFQKYTMTYMNGNTQVDSYEIGEGEGLGALPLPSYSSDKYFVGWFTDTSDPGTKALASAVPTSNTTYYAVFIDAPSTTAGYYTPQNGVELYGLVSYLNSSNLSSAKIFLKNGTYDWGTAAETQLTKSNVSIIGESMDGTILTTIPTQEGLGTATLLYNKGQYNYLQDLTLHNNYPFGNTTGRAASLKDEGNYTICNNVWLYSHQDTYYSHSTGAYFYFKGGKISGCVDYMCGQSRVYYDGVTLSNDSRGSTMTANSELYVFNNCVIENGGQEYNFGRAWSGSPVCVFLNTTLKDGGSKLASTRWNLNGLNTDYSIAGEYGTKNASGTDITPASNNVTFKKNNTQMNTILTAEQAATYTMEYTLGDWATTAASDVEQATVTDVKLDGNTLSWTGTSDAYLIEKNGEFVALTTDASYDVSAAGLGTYTVRAANSRGGFGEAVEAETGGDAVTLTWTLATGTSATALSSTQTSTSEYVTSANMTAISATANDQSGKDGLTVKLNVGTADAAAATVTFTVPAGFAFIPHKTTAKVQPISKDAYVKLDVNGIATEATSFTQGTITTAALTESTERMLTGTVTIGIYVYDGASTGVTTYRLGSPITISGELVATVSTLANRNYGTYVTGCGLDFTDVTDATAFIATGFTSSQDAIVLQQVNKVAANTPLIIYTAEKTNAVTVRVPITKDDADAAVADNALVAGDGTTAWDGTSGYTYYYIASDQFHKATSGTLQSGKAYLKVADEDVPAGSRSFGFVFADDSTTGVVSMDNGQWIMDN